MGFVQAQVDTPGLECVKTLMEPPWHRSDPSHDSCFISDRRLVVGIPTPLKNMKVSWDHEIPINSQYMEK